PEPAGDGSGNRLTGDGEVGDRLARLAAPELPRLLGSSHAASVDGGEGADPVGQAPTDLRRRSAGLRDDAEAPALERPLAQEPAGALGQLGARGPAHVAAARALVQGRPALVGANGSPMAAAQAFDLPETHLHGEGIGGRRQPATLERGTLPTATAGRPGVRPEGSDPSLGGSGGRDAAGGRDQLVPGDELDAGTAVRMAASL